MNNQTNNNTQKEKLKIIQLNANSIYSKSKRHQLKQLMIKHNPDIMLISETKLNNKNTVQFNGYKIYRTDRVTNNGGGTAIIIKNYIDSEYIDTPINIKSIECCIAIIKLKNNKKLYVTSIYRPPKNKINVNDLNEIIQINKNALHIIGGDYNAHHKEWNEQYSCTNGKNIYNWYETNKNINKLNLYAAENPTCFRSVPGTYVDFGIYSDELKIINSNNNKKMQSERFTDHAAIVIEMECTPEQISTNIIKDYSKTNWTELKTYINEKIKSVKIPLNKNLNTNEIDAYATIMNNIYNTSIEKYVPELKIPDGLIILSKKSQQLLKEKQKIMRKKDRNKYTYNYGLICNELKEIKKMINDSIKSD